MRVLLVKTSSMGDVLHALPALTDAAQQIDNLRVDWLVEEGFAEIPRWHPAVDKVIAVALRRWRKQPLATWRGAEWKQFTSALNQHHYDLIIDAQGLLKSAWLAHRAQGPIAGYDRHSIREPLASFFYRQRYPVSKNLHAVERIRQLFAQALNYPLPSATGSYGIAVERIGEIIAKRRQLVFLHATSRADKLYPLAQWRQLCELAGQHNYRVCLPWGSDDEREAAAAIAKDFEHVEVMPRLNLQAVAQLLLQSQGAVAVDTGLGHMAAALAIPAVSLYGPTSPALVGAYGQHQQHLSGGKNFSTLTAVEVWQKLTLIVGAAEN